MRGAGGDPAALIMVIRQPRPRTCMPKRSGVCTCTCICPPHSRRTAPQHSTAHISTHACMQASRPVTCRGCSCTRCAPCMHANALATAVARWSGLHGLIYVNGHMDPPALTWQVQSRHTKAVAGMRMGVAAACTCAQLRCQCARTMAAAAALRCAHHAMSAVSVGSTTTTTFRAKPAGPQSIVMCVL